MKRIFLLMAIALFTGALYAQDAAQTPTENAPAPEVKLADLLDTMINGPAQANDNGSTFETPKAFTPGPHEAAFATWQQICHDAGKLGNEMKRKDVVQQMKDALADEKVPNWVKVWLVKQFGWIGNGDDVKAIAVFLTSDDYPLRDEAIRSLSLIQDSKAIYALRKAQKTADDKTKEAIENALRQCKINVRTLLEETEMPMALAYAPAQKVKEWLANYDALSPELKLQTIASLAARGDRKYRSYVLDAFKVQGEDAAVFCEEALLALERLGTKDDIPLLLEKLEFNRGLVIDVASHIEAPGFDKALVKALKACDNMDQFNALARILANRYNTEVSGIVVEKIAKPECPDRVGLLAAALSITAGDERVVLIDALKLFPEGKDRESAEKLLAAALEGNSALVLAKERDWALFLPLLGRLGDDAAWAKINECLGNAELKAAAVKALCNLPNAKQAERMMQVVDGEEFTPEQKLAALRAYIRVVSLPNDKIGIEATPAQKLEWLRAAWGKATRADEKRLILSRLPAIRDLESGKFAMEFIDDPELQQDVCRALIDLAHHNEVRRPNAEFFAPALDKCIELCKDPELVVRAKKYRESM